MGRVGVCVGGWCWKANHCVLDCASRFLRPSFSAAPHDLIRQGRPGRVAQSVIHEIADAVRGPAAIFVRDFMNEPTLQVRFCSCRPLRAGLAACNQAQQAFMGLMSEGKSFPVLGVGGGTLTLGGL